MVRLLGYASHGLVAAGSTDVAGHYSITLAIITALSGVFGPLLVFMFKDVIRGRHDKAKKRDEHAENIRLRERLADYERDEHAADKKATP